MRIKESQSEGQRKKESQSNKESQMDKESKSESNKKSQMETKIVNFLDIDTSKITFSKRKPNKYNGTQIDILYEGKTLFVKYEGITPFGLKENFDKDGNYQGTSMQINCEDEYLEKARELNQFFIQAFYKNKWSLNKNVPIEAIEGYEHGESGLWKRICKNPEKSTLSKKYNKQFRFEI